MTPPLHTTLLPSTPDTAPPPHATQAPPAADASREAAARAAQAWAAGLSLAQAQDDEVAGGGRVLRVRRTLALVDLDAFFVSVERRRDPGLVGRPVVVGGLPGERGVVACASYEARGHGVHAALPLVHAAERLPARCPRCVRAQARADGTPTEPCPRRCPVFLHGDHAAYAAASQQVMEVLERFTPAIEPLSLDEACLDLTGLERHHRSWMEAALALRRAVGEATGLSLSVGIGSTRSVAKVAASLAKPAGVLVVRPGEERAFLAALPLEHLPGVGAKTQAQLERFQLRSIGDLAAMPDDLLVATFGRHGAALAQRARGLDDGLAVGGHEPATRSLSRETSFQSDTDDRQLVEATLSQLAQRAARAMRAEGLRARAVGVRLRYSDFDTVESRLRFEAPTDLDHDILERVRALARARWTRRVRLRLVGVVLHDLVASDERQLDLALRAPGSEQDEAPLRAAGLAVAAGAHAGEALAPYVPRAVDTAIDRIRARHGFRALVRGRAIDLLPRPAREGTNDAGPAPLRARA
ncbi:MAG: DNA polymerase thumb domain-containing protein [Planctomycetia bacterium]